MCTTTWCELWRRRMSAALLLAALGAAAHGQTARFVEPAEASVAVGETVSLSLLEGDNSATWTDEGVEYFLARTAWTQDNRDAVSVAEGSGGRAAGWTADKPGVLLLGVDLAPRTETVEAAAFEAFVRRVLPASRRGALDGLLDDAGAHTVTLRRVESGKALARVASEGVEPTSIATSKTGQAVEIRPLMDPMALGLGSDLPVRVYSSVPGPGDGVVIATNTTTGDVIRAQTNETSLAVVRIEKSGRWRVEFHAIEPGTAHGDDPEHNPEGADWIVHTATLTFTIEAQQREHEQQAGREVTR